MIQVIEGATGLTPFFSGYPRKKGRWALKQFVLRWQKNILNHSRTKVSNWSIKMPGKAKLQCPNIAGPIEVTICREFKGIFLFCVDWYFTETLFAEKAQKKTDQQHQDKFKCISFLSKWKAEIQAIDTNRKEIQPRANICHWCKDNEVGVSHGKPSTSGYGIASAASRENAEDKQLYLHLKLWHERRKGQLQGHNRGLIAHQVSIEKRLKSSMKRQRLGDIWKLEPLIIGKSPSSQVF